MINKPVRAELFILVISVLFLYACQAKNEVGSGDKQPTSSLVSTEEKIAKTVRPKVTPSTNTNEPTPTIQPHLDLLEEQLKDVEIIIWHPWVVDISNKLDALIGVFNKNNEWGIHVKSKSLYSAGELYESITTSRENDNIEIPDLIAAPSEQLAILSSGANLLVPLDEYIQQSSLGMSQSEINAYNPVFWRQDQFEGQQFAIPLLRTAYVIFYNQSWARELGFDKPPVTPVEFKEQACAAAQVNNSTRILELYGTGGWLIDTSPMTFISWLHAFGGENIYDEDTDQYSFNSPSRREALLYLRRMMDEGCAWLNRSSTPQNYLTQRKALFYSGNLQEVYVQQKVHEISQSDDLWTILPYFQLDGTEFIYASGYSLALINKVDQEDISPMTYQNQIAAWLFVKWLSQPENQVILAESMPSVPVSQETSALMNEDEFPWKMILPLSDGLLPAPSNNTWRNVRRLVEDAGWQVYQLPTDQVPEILPELDNSINSMLKGN